MVARNFAAADAIAPRLAPPSELRNHQRRDLNLDLWLTEMSGETVLRCRCCNVSAGGLNATAPIGYGLAVGQRYTVRLSRPGARVESLLLGDELGYATVIRTQLRVNNDENGVGFALRFDVPQYLPV